MLKKSEAIGFKEIQIAWFNPDNVFTGLQFKITQALMLPKESVGNLNVSFLECDLCEFILYSVSQNVHVPFNNTLKTMKR